MTEDNDNSNKHYDGIIEHDHPLPRWWIAIFLGSIIYSMIYYLHYTSHSGPTTDEELAVGIAQLTEMRQSESSEAIDLASAVGNEEFIQVGSKIYFEKCYMCHGDKGQGLIGPNFTDNFWIHGTGKPEDVLHSVQKGVPEKGMPGWESILNPSEQASVVAFVLSLKGSTPAGAKGPEGVEVKD